MHATWKSREGKGKSIDKTKKVARGYCPGNCFSCGKDWHYSYACSNKACSLCSSVGHVPKACPEDPANSGLTEVTSTEKVGDGETLVVRNSVKIIFIGPARPLTRALGNGGDVRSAVSLSTFYDSQAIDVGLFAALLMGRRPRARSFVCDSGSSVRCVTFCSSMTNCRKPTRRKLIVASD